MNKLSTTPAARRPMRLALPAALAAALLLAGACASVPPPTDQVAVSAAAVAHAAGAGGNEAAPQDMRTARDKLQRANVAMTVKDYPLALSLAREAQVDAQLAEARALSNKARKAADVLRDDNRVLREEIERKTK